ncbi:MAG: hypothetical protein A2451_02555 [Bdellovibrionales bacterium RIFOXYC2_FULL_39_8]|nr:MAG: hypothetical protein A2404_07950 [Bdellovibrionales bacterium RIFOXYC1_FULL_39_130]OFZ73925.1 MAG: hypothetical protein A2451_02555 [Bdellovibrionales bacterium RIFOXYC2_FULL_39_8]
MKNLNANEYKSMRIKSITKKSVDTFLEKINKQEDCGKISFDHVINFFIENVTSEEIKKIQLRSVSWVHEEKRLRKLYESKKGKVDEAKWKQMLFIGELNVFIKENSRLQV